MDKRDLKRARINAIVIGSLLGLTLISFVYSFVQLGIAKENLELAIQLETKLMKNEQEFRERLGLCERQSQNEADRADEILARINAEVQAKKK
jgi:hypothetical protein